MKVISMSRRSKSTKRSYVRTVSPKRRDTTRIANSGTYYRSQPELPFAMSLTPIEDRRTFHPMGETRSARSFRQRVSAIRASTPTGLSLEMQRPSVVSHGVSFSAPRDVLVCVRRGIRKEVIHAIGKAGKSGQKSPRRSHYSDVRCK